MTWLILGGGKDRKDRNKESILAHAQGAETQEIKQRKPQKTRTSPATPEIERPGEAKEEFAWAAEQGPGRKTLHEERKRKDAKGRSKRGEIIRWIQLIQQKHHRGKHRNGRLGFRKKEGYNLFQK